MTLFNFNFLIFIMNTLKKAHLRKCLRIVQIYLTSLFDIDTLNKLLNENIDIIIAYLIYFAYEPIEYINMYYDLLKINNDIVAAYFTHLFDNYHYDALVKLKGELENEK